MNNPTITVFGNCRVTGKRWELTIEASKYNRWQDGELIQNVWPEMSPDDRELLISGTTPEGWDILFPPE